MCVGEVTIETQVQQFTLSTGGSFEGVRLVVQDHDQVTEAGPTFIPSKYEVLRRKGRTEQLDTFVSGAIRDDTVFGSLALNPDDLLGRQQSGRSIVNCPLMTKGWEPSG